VTRPNCEHGQRRRRCCLPNANGSCSSCPTRRKRQGSRSPFCPRWRLLLRRGRCCSLRPVRACMGCGVGPYLEVGNCRACWSRSRQHWGCSICCYSSRGSSAMCGRRLHHHWRSCASEAAKSQNAVCACCSGAGPTLFVIAAAMLRPTMLAEASMRGAKGGGERTQICGADNLEKSAARTGLCSAES